MIELRKSTLVVSFPEIHPEATCRVEFQRTLRVPDDNQEYPLPAGLGSLPILPVDDFDVPSNWKKHGGVFMPMYQSEAMWINFRASGDYPFAVKVAAGKVNAVNGKSWSNELSEGSQDYCVIPKQPWLDGFRVSDEVVRQFVAMPLGQGVTAEEQVSGSAEWGGVQLIFYPMKASEFRRRFEHRVEEVMFSREYSVRAFLVNTAEMGLAPGGRIRQEIEEDPYGRDAWDTSVSSRCFVHIVNSEVFRSVTGAKPPTAPITPGQYKEAGVPWFDYYGEGKPLTGSTLLAKLDGVATALLKKGKALPDNHPIPIAKTVRLEPRATNSALRDGDY